MYKFKINYFAVINFKLFEIHYFLDSLLGTSAPWRPAGGALVGAPAVEPRVSPVHRHVLLERVPGLVHLATVVTRVVDIFEMLSLRNA